MAVTTTYNFDDDNEAQDLDFGLPNAAADLTSLASGGFVGIGNSAGAVRGTIYSPAGLPATAFGPATGTNGAIDQLSDDNLVIASQDADSTLFKVVSSTTGAEVVPATDLNLPNSTNPDVVALAGPLGGFVIAYQTNFGAADNDISIAIRSNSGAFITSFAIDSTTANDTDPAIAQLDGGNVVVAWTRTVGADTEIWYAIRSATGTVVKAPTLFDTNGAINRDVSVTALNGGGFALVYEDSEWTGQSDVTLATFSALASMPASSISAISATSRRTRPRASSGWPTACWRWSG